MTETTTERETCPVSGKLRYATEYEARVGLVDAIVRRNRGKNNRRECRWYECPTCHGWHLTSMRRPPTSVAS